MKPVKKIVLVRTDRIGDVILSLPMLPLLKKKFPDAAISVLVREYTQELVSDHSCVSQVLLYKNEGKISSLLAMLRLLRSNSFDLAILPYPRFRTTLLIALAGIPVRIGTGYRWYSFLFNRKIYEHRKDAKRHEVEYNLRLLDTLGIERPDRPEFEFSIPESSKRKIDQLLHDYSLNKPFAILHPGSGGSARDWKPENFSLLGDRLVKEFGLQLIVTGGMHEQGLVNRVIDGMTSPAASFCGLLTLKDMGSLALRASVFISNSTGPLHIAAAVGTPVVALYPPIVQCSPVRWGPYTEKKKIFIADASKCPLCHGGPCRSNVCMDQISVDDVAASVGEFLHLHE